MVSVVYGMNGQAAEIIDYTACSGGRWPTDEAHGRLSDARGQADYDRGYDDGYAQKVGCVTEASSVDYCQGYADGFEKREGEIT